MSGITENPKLESAASLEVYGLQEIMGAEKFSVSTDKSADSFVIDMDSFSNGNDKDVSANSRITMQRTLSRKGSQRLSEKKNAPIVPEKDFALAGHSPRGSDTPEKPSVVAVGTTESLGSPPQVHHHQITITAGNISTNTDGRCYARRNSFRRSPPWGLDPKRVLFFFATLSSMGTILLIYLTLSMGYNSDEIGFDWVQQ